MVGHAAYHAQNAERFRAPRRGLDAFTAHVTAVLFHTLVLRDLLLDRMALWRAKPSPGSQTGAGIEIAV